MTDAHTVTLRHNKVDLALHMLRPEPLDPGRSESTPAAAARTG